VDLKTIKFDPSPNFGVRGPNLISMAIIHACLGTMIGTIATFKNSGTRVSAHYVIDRDGSILQMVKLEDAAWHAMHWPNMISIGIEHVDRYNLAGTRTPGCMADKNWFTKPQLDASAALVAQLMHDFNIPLEKVIGHNDPSLKPYGNTHQDPGPYWPWLEYRKLINQELDKLKVNVLVETDENRENLFQSALDRTNQKQGPVLQKLAELDGKKFKKRRLIK
jgi:N-acetyl-anhydromuramyl-L-alanine amidase AmpD